MLLFSFIWLNQYHTLYTGVEMQKFVQCIFSPRYLLATNAILGTSFMLAGDIIAQEIDIHGLVKSTTTHEEHNNDNSELIKTNITSPQRLKLDPNQSKAMATGGLYFGVTCHYWYLFLDRKFSNNKHSVLKKLLCESAMGLPFAAGLFVVTGLIKKQSTTAITNDFRNSIWYIVAVS